MNQRLQDLTVLLAETFFEGHSFNCLPIPGEQGVLQVLVSDLEALPIYLTVTENQILCITYLCKQEEIQTEQQAELNRKLLGLNVAVPLSSFALVDDYYVIFGALATSSSDEDICRELVTLAANASDALEALESYLV
jgi:uncharacterized protein YjfI (DUF2170 family)